MSCPICDCKPANCDCSPQAIRLHEELEQEKALHRDTAAELEAANLQLGEWKQAVTELLKAPHNSFADAAARERVKNLLAGITEKEKCEHVFINYQCEKCGKGQDVEKRADESSKITK